MKQFFKNVGVGIVIIALLAFCMAYFGGESPKVAEAGVMSLATGTTAATGAAINIKLGFKPRVVVVSRVSATAANNFQATYYDTMASGYCILHTAGALTYVTTSCISPYSGSTTTVPGFSIGTNSSINPSSPADVLYYEATQ